jgi:hypothetical protein
MDQNSVADAYLYAALLWAKHNELTVHPALAVQQALAHEAF